MPQHRNISLRNSTVTGLIVGIFFSFLIGNARAQIMRSQSSKSAKEQQQQKEISWPTPAQLLKEISLFEDHPITASWAARTAELSESLCTETKVTSDEAVEILLALNQQSKATDQLIANIVQTESAGDFSLESSSLISELQRFRYRLDRRIKIWAGVIDHANLLAAEQPNPIQPVSLSWLPPNLDELIQQHSPGTTGWQDYLAWDELIEASRATNMDKQARIRLRKAAQKFLARYHSPSLSAAQRNHFQPYFSADVLDSIGRAATDGIDHTRLLKLIEGLEQSSRGDYTAFLNRQYQNLLWSDDPIAQELAGKIDSHWRNANFRIAINQRLLNQMLPQVPATTQPVSENLQGAQISGQSLIETDNLRIALIPNPDEISLAIETTGHVKSETVAKRSGFTFENEGLANFNVFQKLAFSRTGVTSEAAQATSQVRQKLIGLRGSYDRVPVLGWLSRNIAKKKATEQTPEANALTRERVETGAKQRVEAEVNQIVNQFRVGIHQHVLSRLIAMDLEPETVQLSTSQDRIVGRYRIAGRDQMAAWQPRPTDYETDLLTVQLHQSAFNNLLQRFDLSGKEFNVDSFAKHIEKVTGFPNASKKSDNDATFSFKKYDAIRLDFEDGIASVKFSFKSFQIGKGRPWKNITIKANFKPTYYGTEIVLDRDNLFEVESTSDLRLTDQIAIRGAFKVILDERYSFDLLPSVVRQKIPSLSLGINRLSLARGWCGVAFTNATVGQFQPHGQFEQYEQFEPYDQEVIIVNPGESVLGTQSGNVGSLLTGEVFK